MSKLAAAFDVLRVIQVPLLLILALKAVVEALLKNLRHLTCLHVKVMLVLNSIRHLLNRSAESLVNGEMLFEPVGEHTVAAVPLKTLRDASAIVIVLGAMLKVLLDPSDTDADLFRNVAEWQPILVVKGDG